MNDHTATLDRADEEALVYDVSDEALEAAAGTSVPLAARSNEWCTGNQPPTMGVCCAT